MNGHVFKTVFKTQILYSENKKGVLLVPCDYQQMMYFIFQLNKPFLLKGSKLTICIIKCKTLE